MGKRFANWLASKTDKYLDSNRPERVQAAADALDRGLSQLRERFTIDTALGELEFYDGDLKEAVQIVYRRAVQRAWADEKVSDGERKALTFMQRVLEVQSQDAARIERDVGNGVFERVFATVMSDGKISPAEQAKLSGVAASLGRPINELCRQFFSDQSEAFLRAAFAKAAEDGKVAADEWREILSTARILGLTEGEVLAAVRHQVRQYVEHTIADAKSDGRISAEEVASLRWLIANLIQDGTALQEYVAAEVANLQTIEKLERGELPSLDTHQIDLALKSGEILHAFADTDYTETKARRHGPEQVRYGGRVYITDSRLIFDADEKAFDLSHGRVLKINVSGDVVRIRCSGRGAGSYDFARGPMKHVGAIYAAAVRRANRTLTQEASGLPTRHIARDIRQRVWQRYGGRCAQCSSDQYLEFDHIIPHSRGGSNSDNNVQLLCRKCNLEKSDSL